MVYTWCADMCRADATRSRGSEFCDRSKLLPNSPRQDRQTYSPSGSEKLLLQLKKWIYCRAVCPCSVLD